MAVSLSNNSILPPPSRPRLSSSPKLIKTLSLRSLNHRPTLGFPLVSSSSSINNRTRPAFKSFFAVNGMEGVQNQNDVKASESEGTDMKQLIEAYKGAILHGDEKTISDIEARIRVIENQKNDLLHEVTTLFAEITSGKQKYIRLQADFDNFRKRSDKERLTVQSRTQEQVIETLLQMVDSFERAKQQLKPTNEREKKIDTSYQGIYKQFVEIMRSLQVAVVPAVGKPFNPALHEAIAREESEEFNEGIIIQECRRGFLLGDRLLRPATVKVSAGPGRKKAPMTSENSAGQPTTAAGVDER